MTTKVSIGLGGTGSNSAASTLTSIGAVAKSGDTMTGALLLAAGSNTAPAISRSTDTDTGIYFPANNEMAITAGGTVAQAFNSGGVFFRNRIINGDMRIDQRNAGASVTPTSSGYTLDRWQAVCSAASKYSVQQNAASVTPPTGYKNYLGVTSLSSYSVAAGDFFFLSQYIEGFNTADLSFGASGALTVTISFWVRSSLTGSFGGSIQNSAQNRCYPFTYTISVANTWEYKTITIAGDTTGTWLTDNGRGIGVIFGLGVGSTYSGTAGAWVGSQIFVPTGSTSIVGTNGATFYITGVQLETGSVATPFERRPYGTEFMLCQRYFQQLEAGGIGGAVSTTAVALGGQFPVPMRATPTASLTSAMKVDVIGITAVTQSASNILSINGGNSAESWSAYFANFTGLTQFNPIMKSNSGNTSKLQFSIEL